MRKIRQTQVNSYKELKESGTIGGKQKHVYN